MTQLLSETQSAQHIIILLTVQETSSQHIEPVRKCTLGETVMYRILRFLFGRKLLASFGSSSRFALEHRTMKRGTMLAVALMNLVLITPAAIFLLPLVATHLRAVQLSFTGKSAIATVTTRHVEHYLHQGRSRQFLRNIFNPNHAYTSAYRIEAIYSFRTADGATHLGIERFQDSSPSYRLPKDVPIEIYYLPNNPSISMPRETIGQMSNPLMGAAIILIALYSALAMGIIRLTNP